MGRARATEDRNERAALRALVDACEGNISEMSRRLGNVSRQVLMRKLARYKLTDKAATARTSAGIAGPRSVETTPNRERLLRLVARGGYREAALKLKISPRTMVRRMRDAGLTGDEIRAARRAAR